MSPYAPEVTDGGTPSSSSEDSRAGGMYSGSSSESSSSSEQSDADSSMYRSSEDSKQHQTELRFHATASVMSKSQRITSRTEKIFKSLNIPLEAGKERVIYMVH